MTTKLPACQFPVINGPERKDLHRCSGTAAELSLVPIQRLEALGLPPERIVIELTEALPVHDLGVLVKAIALFRKLGFAIALDDLGEGFSSLRLWSELRPEYVAVPCPSGAFLSHHEIAAATAVAKKEAKRMPGCSLFVERRSRQAPAIMEPCPAPTPKTPSTA